jgi:hypothetical protein
MPVEAHGFVLSRPGIAPGVASTSLSTSQEDTLDNYFLYFLSKYTIDTHEACCAYLCHIHTLVFCTHILTLTGDGTWLHPDSRDGDLAGGPRRGPTGMRGTRRWCHGVDAAPRRVRGCCGTTRVRVPYTSAIVAGHLWRVEKRKA